MSIPIDESYVICFRSLVGYIFVGQGNFETSESSKASATSETFRPASFPQKNYNKSFLAVLRYLYTVGTRGKPCGLERLKGGTILNHPQFSFNDRCLEFGIGNLIKNLICLSQRQPRNNQEDQMNQIKENSVPVRQVKHQPSYFLSD